MNKKILYLIIKLDKKELIKRRSPRRYNFKKSIFIIFILLAFPKLIYAHPGNTASDGCHYCWTNCDYWGEVYGERHCHNGDENYYNDEEYSEDSEYNDEEYSEDSEYTDDGKSNEASDEKQSQNNNSKYWVAGTGAGVIGIAGYYLGKNRKTL